MSTPSTRPARARFKFAIFLALMLSSLTFLSRGAQAQSNSINCPDREPETVRATLDVLRKLQDGTLSGRSVDEVLSHLPAELKSNFMVFTGSLSRQPANTSETLLGTYPGPDGRLMKNVNGKPEIVFPEGRFVLASPQGDVSISFTTDKNSPGFGNVEAAVFQPIGSNLELFDVRTKENSEHSGDRAHVEKNSEKCTGCHGTTPNWRFDSYRMWHGMTPFVEDTLRKGSIETEWYNHFLERIEKGEDRLRQLKPLNTQAAINAGIEAKGLYQLRAPESPVNFGGTYTPALNFSHQLLEKNGCRAIAQLAKRPDFDKIKYALLGSLLNCQNVESFLSPEQAKNAAAYFRDRKTGVSRVGIDKNSFSLDKLVADTRARQRSATEDKIGRQTWLFEKFAGLDQAQKEIAAARAQDPSRGPGYGVRSFDIYASEIGKARYLLEPLGVGIAGMSTAVDREQHTYAEFLSRLLVQQPFRDIFKNDLGRDIDAELGPDAKNCNSSHEVDGTASICESAMKKNLKATCEALAKLSQAALNDEKKPSQTRFICESKSTLEKKAREVLKSATEPILASKVDKILNDHECSFCHTMRQDGAPDIALGNVGAFKNMVLKTNGKPGDFADRVWDRVSRHPDMHGSMPKNRPPLSSDEKATLKAYLDLIKQTPPPPAP